MPPELPWPAARKGDPGPTSFPSSNLPPSATRADMEHRHGADATCPSGPEQTPTHAFTHQVLNRSHIHVRASRITSGSLHRILQARCEG